VVVIGVIGVIKVIRVIRVIRIKPGRTGERKARGRNMAGSVKEIGEEEIWRGV
jgi:hypothetical protein